MRALGIATTANPHKPQTRAGALANTLLSVVLSFTLCFCMFPVLQPTAALAEPEETTLAIAANDELGNEVTGAITESSEAQETATQCDTEFNCSTCDEIAAASKNETVGNNEAQQENSPTENDPEDATLGIAPVDQPDLSAQETKTFKPITKDTAANAAQLVIVVEFSNSPEASNRYDDAPLTSSTCRTQWEYIDYSLNANDSSLTRPTFRSYLEMVSDGKQKVASYLPQSYTDGTHMRIRVNMTAQDYAASRADELLIQAAFEKLNQRTDLDPAIFDVNNDGCIDNVLLVPEIQGYVSNFSSHQGYVSTDIKLRQGNNTRSVNAYTVVHGGISGTIDGFSSSIAVHEYLHTLGARDYYRNTNTSEIGGTPVGFWDIMAKGGEFSWPLAFTRESLGWTTIQEIDPDNLEQSYTLCAPGSISVGATQALKIASPYSENEFFVLEYRRLNSGGDEINGDYALGASGLVVYRVNKQYWNEGNAYGHDYVYVFRPGETSLTASAGDTQCAAVRNLGYRSQIRSSTDQSKLRGSIGMTDLSKGIADGAIVDSQGNNIGLEIVATGQNDNSITIQINRAAIDTSDFWSPVVSEDKTSPLKDLESPATSMTTDGSNIYVLAEDQNAHTAAIYKYDGSNWTQIGSKRNEVEGGKIAWHNGKLYFAYAESDHQATLLEWYENDRLVSGCSVSAKSPDYAFEPALGVAGNNIYLLANHSASRQLYRIDHSAGLNPLVTYGEPFSVDVMVAPTVLDLGGKVAVAAALTETDNWRTALFQLNESTWKWQETLKLFSTTVPYISTATFKGKTYILAKPNTVDSSIDGKMFAFKNDGTYEGEQTVPNDINMRLGAMLFAGTENMYLCIADQPYAKVFTIPDGDLSKTAQLGDNVYQGATSSDIASSIGIAAAAVGNKLFVAISDPSTGIIAVRSHTLAGNDTAVWGHTGKTSIKDAVVTGIGDKEYTGNPHVLDLDVTLNGKPLTNGTDYRVEYADNVNVGTAYFDVVGIGEYSGVVNGHFQITRAKVAEPTAKTGLVYNGEAQSGVNVPDGCYAIAASATNAGNYYALVMPDSNHKWADGSLIMKSFDYSIAKADLSGAQVSAINDHVWGGTPITPWPEKVVCNGRTLIAGTDYTVTHAYNNGIGTAAAYVDGIGNYTGRATKTFNIVKEPEVVRTSVHQVQASCGQFTRNATGKPQYTWMSASYGGRTLQEGTDYQVVYYRQGESSPSTPVSGVYGVYIRGIGQFGDERQVGTINLMQGPKTGSPVKISSVSNANFVLDASGASPRRGANVTIWSDNGGSNQKWYLWLDDAGYYTLRSTYNTKFTLDAAGATPKKGSNVSIWDANGGNNQKWYIEPTSNGYIFHSVADWNLVLDASGATPKQGANVTTWTNNGGKNQRWNIKEVTVPSFDANRTYQIKSASNSKFVLDASGKTPKIGANVTIWGNNGGLNQRWRLVPVGNGYYYIQSASNNNFLLDAAGKTPKKGSNASIWTNNGGRNQLWKIEPLATGHYVIKNAANESLVLDASGANPKQGANVTTWTSNGGYNQKWIIE